MTIKTTSERLTEACDAAINELESYRQERQELMTVIARLMKGEKPVCSYCTLACMPTFDSHCEACDEPSVQEKLPDSSSWQDDHRKRFFMP